MGSLAERSNIAKFFINVLNDPERKSIFRMLTEVSFYSVRTGKFAKHYFSRFLYRKNNPTNFFDYYRDKELISLWGIYNQRRFMDVLENKYFFYLFFSRRNFPIPKLLAYNDSNQLMFTESHETFSLDTEKNLEELLLKIVKKAPGKAIIIKGAYDSFGGKNIYKIKEDEFPLKADYLSGLLTHLKSSSFLFQDCLMQHETMNKMFPNSVNTMRINTFLNKESKARAFCTCVRFGTGENHVDNVSSGGIYTVVNQETGELNDTAFTSLTFGGKKFTHHPSTGLAFKDFRIPQIKEAIELACRAGETLPSLRMVGWDIAITPDGPVIVEGNPRVSHATVESAYGGYRQTEAFQDILEEAGLL